VRFRVAAFVGFRRAEAARLFVVAIARSVPEAARWRPLQVVATESLDVVGRGKHRSWHCDATTVGEARMRSDLSEDEFWEIVAASRRRISSAEQGDVMDRQDEELRSILKKLGPERIVAFRDRLREHLDRAYAWELWGAAHVINQGCGDDGFLDFKWLADLGGTPVPSYGSNSVHGPERALRAVGATHRGRLVRETHGVNRLPRS
jgi:hypothetical protein